MRTAILVITNILLIISCISGSQKGNTQKKNKTPNIIFILTDDYSAKEVSCYGGPVHTPAMDKMASEGVQFLTAWSAPLCGPSRAILHTGKYAHNQGYYDNYVQPSVKFLDDERHLPILNMANQAGYATGMYGKVHHFRSNDASSYGADDYCLWQNWEGHDGPYARFWHPSYVANGKGVVTNKNDFGPDVVFNKMIQFIDEQKNNPFFVYWPATLAHQEKDPETGKWHFPDMPEVDEKGNRTGKLTKGSLESMIRCQDGLLKQLMDYLDSTGLIENTVVFFAGDNGTPGYGKGKYNNELGLRVPFVVAGGPVQKLGKTDVLIDFSDIWPTVAELVQYEGRFGGTEKVDGHSFASLLLGQPYTPREYIEMTASNARWLRNNDWLLDGYGHFWDCRDTRKEWEYRDVTFSTDSTVINARKQFENRLQQIPLPDYDNPLTKESWKKFRETTPEVEVYRPPYLSNKTN